MSASDARSISVTMSVARGLGRRPSVRATSSPSTQQRPRPARRARRASVEQLVEVRSATADTVVSAVPCARRPPLRHRHPADAPRCGGRWPRPRSATTATARTRPCAASRRRSPRGSARRRRCSCRRGRWATRSRCACSAGPAPRSSPAAASTSSSTRQGGAGVNGCGAVRTCSTTTTATLDPVDVAAHDRGRPHHHWLPVQRGVRREHPHAVGRRAVAASSGWRASPRSGVPVHLDGARLFNAEVATGVQRGRVRRGMRPR